MNKCALRKTAKSIWRETWQILGFGLLFFIFGAVVWKAGRLAISVLGEQTLRILVFSIGIILVTILVIHGIRDEYRKAIRECEEEVVRGDLIVGRAEPTWGEEENTLIPRLPLEIPEPSIPARNTRN